MREREAHQEDAEAYCSIVLSREGGEEKERIICRKSEVDSCFGNVNDFRLLEADRMLSDYRTLERILEIGQQEGARYENLDYGNRMLREENELQLRLRMYEIRRLILSLDDDDAKLFLYYRYIYGETILRCAEMLSISRATVYRLRRRALLMVADFLAEERLKA